MIVLLKVMEPLHDIVEEFVKVTGAVDGKERAPNASVMLPPIEIAVAPLEMANPFNAFIFDADIGNMTCPFPGVRVSEVNPLMVLVAPENVMF